MMAEHFKYYQYNPSSAAAIIFFVLFLCTTLLHFYQLVRTRTWIVIPLVVGGFCKLNDLAHSELQLTRRP